MTERIHFSNILRLLSKNKNNKDQKHLLIILLQMLSFRIFVKIFYRRIFHSKFQLLTI